MSKNMLLEKPEEVVVKNSELEKCSFGLNGFHINTAVFEQDEMVCFRRVDLLIRDSQFCFVLNFLHALPNQMTDGERKLFQCKEIDVENIRTVEFVYRVGTFSDEAYQIESKNLPSWDLIVQKKKKQMDTKSPSQAAQIISIEECARMLKTGRALFFTGSGISLAAGIPTGELWWKNMGFESDKAIDALTAKVLREPSEELKQLINDFKLTFIKANPTPAHIALTKICMNLPAQVITGNGDMLQEKAGIKAWFVMSGHFDEYKKPLPIMGNFACIEANSDWLQEIDCLVCIGMGRDIKDIVALYRQKNPLGKVISIDIKQPQFAEASDYFLQGDVQELLPALAELI